jgi:hypothetical protein
VSIQRRRVNLQLAPVFYDCEASSSSGLPIEIGWAFANPATGKIHSESRLVRPPPEWDLGPVWDLDAEKLHKITKEELYANGHTPIEIMNRMNKRLTYRQLYSDHPCDDRRWWFQIYAASVAPAKAIGDTKAFVKLKPRFRLQHMNANHLLARLAARRGWDAAAYDAAKALAARVAPTKHRAEADARHLAVLWLIIWRGPHGRAD